MEKEQKYFLNKIEQNITTILEDYLFNNYQKQLIAKKLKAFFNSTYDEDYLWNKNLYISNNSCLLISEGINERLTTRALKTSAEIYENLSKISEKYDREYCYILSALCYDLAGYQSNAFCMLKNLKNTPYKFDIINENEDITVDNYILFHIQQILLKNIFKARNNINNHNSDDIGLNLFNDAIKSWYQNVLDGENTEFLLKIHSTYKYYLSVLNIPISHLLLLLKTRLEKYVKRSIWQNLISDVSLNNYIWNRYIKLLTYDFYDENKIKDAHKRISKFELWTSQLRAIEKGLLSEEKNYVIQMPTSTGKTFVAEISILDHLIKYPDKKCIYIAPFKALTSEKQIELSKNLSKLGYSISSISGSYEMDEFQDVILKESDVLIATPEKIDLLLRIKPEYFENISLMVIDEGHIVGDVSPRSSLLEFLIIRLRIKIESLRILFISAVMPPTNADEYSLWLSSEKENVIRSLLFHDSLPNEEWEPTRKLIGKFEWTGENGRIDFINTFIENKETKEMQGAYIPSITSVKSYGQYKKDKFPRDTSLKNNPKKFKYAKTEIAVLLGYKMSDEGKTLIFCGQTNEVEWVGSTFLRFFKLENENIRSSFGEVTEKESYFYAKKWFGENSYIVQCIKRGIGIHYGDMPEQVRNAVENDYRKGDLHILISTNTVGQGMNFPIKNLIFYSAEIFNEISRILSLMLCKHERSLKIS